MTYLSHFLGAFLTDIRTYALFAVKPFSKPSIALRYLGTRLVDNQLGVAGITVYKKDDNSGNALLNDFYWDESVPANIIFFGLDGGYDVKIAGEVKNHAQRISITDDCEISCIDWYGNSRPFFINGRIFALTGDELIELQLIGNEINEIRRVNIKMNSL